jgi:hypothetical protein
MSYSMAGLDCVLINIDDNIHYFMLLEGGQLAEMPSFVAGAKDDNDIFKTIDADSLVFAKFHLEPIDPEDVTIQTYEDMRDKFEHKLNSFMPRAQIKHESGKEISMRQLMADKEFEPLVKDLYGRVYGA